MSTDDQSQQTLTNDQEKLNKELFDILHNDLNGSTIEDINSLLRKGADPNAQNQDGTTPLHVAVNSGCKEVVEVLIKNKANIHAVDKDKHTPLYWAAKNGHKEVVEVLIKNEANVNAVNKDRYTPLYWATQNGHTKVAKALIDKGANPLLGYKNVRFLKHLITLIRNDSSKHPEKVEEPQQVKEPVDDEYELLKYSLLLRENRPLIDVVEKDTFDSLLCAWFAEVSNLTPDQKKLNDKLLGILKGFLFYNNESRNDRIKELKDFLDKNEDNKEDLSIIINLGRGESRLTLLHALSSINDLLIEEFINLLLKAGADLNAKDDSERTPLHYAAYSGCDNIDLLLRKGARSIPDKQGKTPVEIAIDNHNYHAEYYFLTDEQRSLEEELYNALRDHTQLEKLLNEPKNTQNLKRILNLRTDKGKSQILQHIRNIHDETICKEAERLLLKAGAIDYEGLNKEEHLPKPGTLWDNLVLNQQKLLKFFLHKVGEAQDMNELKQVVIQAIDYGVRFNFPHQGKLYGKTYESKYSFTDYVIKRIKDISESKKNPKVASDIVCELVSRGAVLYNIDSTFVIDTLESEFKDHKTNMKEAYEDYVNFTLQFMEVAKSATSGKIKNAKLDNSTLYLEYSEDSTIHVAEITDGARDLGLTGETGYGRDVIKIGKSEVEIITQNDIRYYTDLADGSDIVLTFPTSLGELEVRLYPDKQNQNIIRVEGNKEMLKKLEDCGEEIGQNCRWGGLPVKEAIGREYFTRSGGLMRFEAMSPYEKVLGKAEAAVKGLEPGSIVNSSLDNTSSKCGSTHSVERFTFRSG
ncbi:MAG: ankyrin repeat domain-containing protein [Wolbachia endosymbiont of Menacanthus eurysternus]|nr:ankyrin repeat domain-containing protein [Wolbachia endosymbiont of Menacanthus eurysternus]